MTILEQEIATLDDCPNLDRIVGLMAEEIPMLRADCAALQARCAAQAKALAVILEKARQYADGYQPFHPGAKLLTVYVPLTPGEIAIIEKAAKT